MCLGARGWRRTKGEGEDEDEDEDEDDTDTVANATCLRLQHASSFSGQNIDEKNGTAATNDDQ